MDPQPTNTNAKRLMIVDDDVEMRTLLAEYFRRLGFAVAEKESGAAALQTVTTESFDCFILDVSMPEMSGLELLRKLRDRGIDIEQHIAIGIAASVPMVIIEDTRIALPRAAIMDHNELPATPFHRRASDRFDDGPR